MDRCYALKSHNDKQTLECCKVCYRIAVSVNISFALVVYDKGKTKFKIWRINKYVLREKQCGYDFKLD